MTLTSKKIVPCISKPEKYSVSKIYRSRHPSKILAEKSVYSPWLICKTQATIPTWIFSPNQYKAYHGLIIEQYLSRSQEIIGDRTRAELRYDKEVIRWLRKGREIKKAIKKANKKYPNEALKLDGSEIDDVASYYDYLLEHENIIHKISH